MHGSVPRMDAKDARRRLSHQITYARIMAGKQIEHMQEVCGQLLKRHKKGIEVTSPRPILASDDVSGRSRATSDWSCVDCKADGQKFGQGLIDLVQAEVDERAVRFMKIINSKNRRISKVKRQLAKAQRQQH